MKSSASRIQHLLVCFLVAMAPPLNGHSQPAGRVADPTIQNAMDKVYPALVRIYVVVESSQDGRIVRNVGAGSGAIISPDGYVVTNHHVAGNATHIVVNLSSQEEVRADLIGTDVLTDIAVLKIRKNELRDPARPLPFARWADSSGARVGDVVYAMGSPGALSQSITKGVLSNINLIPSKFTGGGLRLDGEDVNSMVSWFSHDAQIYGGNSGGPLVNRAGDIVGINEVSLVGLGGAIPSNVARESAAQIMKYGVVRRAWVGLELQPRLRSDRKQVQGVLVSGVLPGSPAESAGLKTGDILLAFNGQPLNGAIPEDMPLVNRTLAAAPIDSPVRADFIRNGEKQTATLHTVLRQRNILPVTELKEWGITARDISRTTAINMELAGTEGVLIDGIRAAGPVAESRPKLMEEDIITAMDGRPVTSVAVLKALTAAAQSRDRAHPEVMVTVKRKKREILASLVLGKSEPQQPVGTAGKAWLPIDTQVLTPELAKMLHVPDVQGVRVTYVAEKAPYPLEVGDIITAFNGEAIEARRVEDSTVFSMMLRQQQAGRQAKLKVLRQGKALEVEVTLQAAPMPAEQMPFYEDGMFEFTARDRNAAEHQQDEATPGLRVEKVEKGGWAQIGGLSTGDILQTVNGRAITDVKVLQDTLRDIEKSRPRYVVMLVKRGVELEFLELEPQWKDIGG